MRFRIEFSAKAERDFALIFDHLFESNLSFGESVETALDHCEARIPNIRRKADRLASAPFRGESHDDLLPGLRHLTIDRVVYWFEMNETEQRVLLFVIFFGSQDHFRRMLTLLLTPRGGCCHAPHRVLRFVPLRRFSGRSWINGDIEYCLCDGGRVPTRRPVLVPKLPLRNDRSLLCYLQFGDVLSTRSTSKAEGSTTDVG